MISFPAAVLLPAASCRVSDHALAKAAAMPSAAMTLPAERPDGGASPRHAAGLPQCCLTVEKTRQTDRLSRLPYEIITQIDRIAKKQVIRKYSYSARTIGVSMLSISSTCSLVITSGGTKRRTLLPALIRIRPASCAFLIIPLTGTENSSPCIRPIPR